ncbi:phosphoribosylformylglycinamidine synthase subunit PurQ [Candidatus Poriferisodalis sp.]|uniref:phosphoribosylformylglycinamidine synthase subunit PurQ n=1 Tax=Candidatus Poriferisodalis sp. TaxID=3101277 RepID=UPI003B013D82
MSVTVGVVRFPGTNCDLDTLEALAELGAATELLSNDQRSLPPVDAVVIPGGFAHGDYLRTGAIAKLSPVMIAVTSFAHAGGPVVGVCNGFQVLTEAGLLPGALRPNAGLSFLCQQQRVVMATVDHVLGHGLSRSEELSIPINHFAGNFVCDEPTLRRLRDSDQIVMRYVDNPNGSLDDIAGICNEARNVVGLMPHPERATDELLGSTDGIRLLNALLHAATDIRQLANWPRVTQPDGS